MFYQYNVLPVKHYLDMGLMLKTNCNYRTQAIFFKRFSCLLLKPFYLLHTTVSNTNTYLFNEKAY